jgi:hypothetical protein
LRAGFLGLALLAGPLAAQEEPQPALALGEVLEVEVRADLDGDGLADLAYVAASEGSRELRVVTSSRSTTRSGGNAPQVLALDSDPLGDADLSVRGNVLTLGELVGGTTAVASTHQFRWDPALKAMRLIGLDATLYSRTLAHDGQEATWNLLTGDFVTRTLGLNKGAADMAYMKTAEKKRKKASRPVRLEDAPSGSDLIGWPDAK